MRLVRVFLLVVAFASLVSRGGAQGASFSSDFKSREDGWDHSSSCSSDATSEFTRDGLVMSIKPTSRTCGTEVNRHEATSYGTYVVKAGMPSESGVTWTFALKGADSTSISFEWTGGDVVKGNWRVQGGRAPPAHTVCSPFNLPSGFVKEQVTYMITWTEFQISWSMSHARFPRPISCTAITSHSLSDADKILSGPLAMHLTLEGRPSQLASVNVYSASYVAVPDADHHEAAGPAGMELSAADEATQNTNASRALRFELLQALGVTRFRAVIELNQLDPCLGADAVNAVLDGFTEFVHQAASYGIKTEMTFTGINAAGWGAAACPGALPSGLNVDVTAYGTLMRTLIPRYVAAGVDRFTPWNEPNNPLFLCGEANSHGECTDISQEGLAKKYAAIYLEAQHVMDELRSSHQIGSSVQLQMGELSPRPDTPNFLAELFANGAKYEADGFTVHPYQLCTPPDSTSSLASVVPAGSTGGCQVQQGGGGAAVVPVGVGFGVGFGADWQLQLAHWHSNGQLRTRSGGQVPLYYNEFGYMTNYDTIPCVNNAARDSYRQVPEAAREAWFPLALDKARHDGAKGMLIYQLMPGGAVDGFDSSILYANCTPTPTFLAIRKWATSNGYPVSANLPTDSCPPAALPVYEC